MYINGTGTLNTRLNIDVLSDPAPGNPHKIQWDLFLRSLLELQQAPPEDPLGYYRIAGIHGWPTDTWPEINAQFSKLWYCSHGNTKFLTWHRPYILLMEQRICEIAVRLANGAPLDLRPVYIEEAKKIRMPFWDFGYKSDLPAAAVKRTALVIIPERDRENPITIHNPLYSYRSTGAGLDPFINATNRPPDSLVNRRLGASGLRSDVYHALTTRQRYNAFSNTTDGNISIEKPHNSVHNALSPTMQDPLVTAFDPIFWLMHTAIDYYYAMWQARNPDEYYNDNTPGGISIDNHLAPFYRSEEKGAWTSRMVQRSENHFPTTYEVGYQYPETLASLTAEERKAAVNAAIDERYKPQDANGGIPGLTKEKPVDFPEDIPPEAVSRHEWRLVAKVKKNLVLNNFGIYFFLDKPPDEVEDWAAKAVGSFHTFKAPLEKCENCQRQEEFFMNGSIYLTDRLAERLPRNTSLYDREDVQNWLKGNLHWRIGKVDGTEYKPQDEDAKSISIRLESFEEAYVPTGESFIPSITEDILGRTFDLQDHDAVDARGSAQLPSRRTEIVS